MNTSTIGYPETNETIAGTGLFARARNRFWLAPMAGITHAPYRQLMDEQGAGVIISELVSTKGLRYGSVKTVQMIRVHENPETIIGIQLFGEEALDYIAVTDQVAQAGADFIDINLGCPVKKVVKKGCGAALMRDPLHLEKFLSQIRKNICLPLTVKMRTGWNQKELNIRDCVKAAENAGCEWVAIHGRTREQAYAGKADWELIADVKQGASIPIIGNGDIRSAEKAQTLLEETGVDAVMIGRGALRNPWIFRQCLGETINGFSLAAPLLHRYRDLLATTFDNRLKAMFLRKQAMWLAHGYPGAAQFRRGVFQLPTADEVIALAEEFFNSVAHLPTPVFEESEAFMMGGHG
ncbi:MAG: transcriptional regulator [Candidatus Nitronauta litoralis]|uniref:tRNA-dihydrouridine synthase n=1 Tax=Candidatus Nitronauta litoralis TaxID=2705533 RepID=A0A7T0BUV0_9BACT|nr:MAG: transcriptional regulator [Candidatus Nitronauta litoralis]